jgi:GrpB-like predicted nucleotidyltransferase (UPF0157 family)
MHTCPQFRHVVYSRGLMIVLVPYDRAWPPTFAAEATRLRRALPDLFVGLQHMGSTAIPGLIAKPVIDMLAVVDSVEAVDLHRETFEALGYEVMGEFGIPGRRYFRKDDSSGRRTHQLHAFVRGSSHIVRHLDFRDYLRAHPAVAEAYGLLKQRLAAECENDTRRYTEGKTAFVQEIEERAARWKTDRVGE